MKISIYDIQDKPLGQGGMGKVYLGSDSRGNIVAIKEMLAEFVTDADLRARFHQEVKISSQMEHPSIVKMYASFEEAGNLYLVMEYIEGETIQQYVKNRGAIHEGEAIRLIGETLSALGYAHQKGFVHRDIKPSNIMVRPNGSICLLDFGIAKDMNSNGLTVGQATIGTDGYMSPEQAGGYNIDHRSDIYSLGCVLFYMLTGHHAIEKRSNDLDTRMAIIQNDFPQAADYNPNVSAKTQKIVNKATHKNMQQRFQSCGEFELALRGEKTMDADNTVSISIGRENCDINIPHQKVSRHHADIRLVAQAGRITYLFQDRSSNGTMIDGMKIHNGEIEIIPQNNPVILLAGTAELRWDTVEDALRKRGIVNDEAVDCVKNDYQIAQANGTVAADKPNGTVSGLDSELLKLISTGKTRKAVKLYKQTAEKTSAECEQYVWRLSFFFANASATEDAWMRERTRRIDKFKKTALLFLIISICLFAIFIASAVYTGVLGTPSMGIAMLGGSIIYFVKYNSHKKVKL
jgi:serine/threonine-protein kinase